MLAVWNRQPTRLSATAHRTSSPAARATNRGFFYAVQHAASVSFAPYTPAWTSGTTRRPAGTRVAGCPRRRQSARGDLSLVPSDGADNKRRATAGRNRGMTCRYRVRAAFSGTGLTGAPRRPAFGALQSALVGVQPTTVPGVPSRGAGKAAASSRIALPLRRASVVSTVSASERVETTPRNDARRYCNPFNKGGLCNSNWPQTAFRGSNTRKSHPGFAERQLFSPESQGHQAARSGRVIPSEPLAG